MNKNTVLIVGGIAVLGLAGYLAWTYYQKNKQTPTQQPTAGNQTAPTTGNQVGQAIDNLSQIGDALGIF